MGRHVMPLAFDGSPRPNILFVFSDQHRFCDLGCYGNESVRTPHLDAFAQEAVRFADCIANSPVCVPSRGSLLTGLYPLRHGAVANDLPVSWRVSSIADALAAAGYHTGYIGKWHLAGVPRDQQIPPGRGRLGFAEWKVCNCNHNYLAAYYYDETGERHPVSGYEPVTQTDLALDFIGRQGTRPWALVLSWGPPHDPYDAVPERYLRLYDAEGIPLRANVPETTRVTTTRTLSRAQVRGQHRGYFAHITALDEQFGRLVAALEETGQRERTIVVYTSDHGDMLGSQGLSNKQLPYEESIHVPLLVRWPGHTFVGVQTGLIGLVDLPVSLLGLAGVSMGDTDGQDLHHLFLDPRASGRPFCYIFDLIPAHQAMARGGREWRGLRTPRYTFARTASDEGFLLFDNREDPLQLDNRVNAPSDAALRDRLRTELSAEVSQHDALLPWEDFIRQWGLREEWNRSQSYFHHPLLPPL